MTKGLSSILEEHGYSIKEEDLQNDRRLGKRAYWKKIGKDGVIIWNYMAGGAMSGSGSYEYLTNSIYMVGNAHNYFNKIIKKNKRKKGYGGKIEFEREKIVFNGEQFNTKELKCKVNYFKEQLNL
jgi:hypothetical protein